MKSIISIACLMLVVGLVSVEARPKRSVIYTAGVPVASHVAVASVPVVQQSHVVHHNPTTVVKTQQVQSGNHASYSYSSEVQSNPVVHTQTHAAVAHVPVVAHRYAAAAPVVAYPVAHSYYNYGYHPASYYSPYSYVIGK